MALQLAQQRAAQTELEDHRRQLTELLQSKQHLQTTVADMKDRLEREFIAKNEETGTRRSSPMWALLNSFVGSRQTPVTSPIARDRSVLRCVIHSKFWYIVLPPVQRGLF
jgi:hypothetical protein